jgi:type IV secretion system protein VirB6
MGRLGAGLIKHHGGNLAKQLGGQGGRAVAWTGKTVARGAWNAYQNRKRNSIRPAKTAAKSLTYKP